MKTLLWSSNNKESSKKLYDYLNYLNDKNNKKGKIKSKDYLVTIKSNRPIRSHDQNSYYWICLQAIASETGDTKEQLHEWYKLEFNSMEFRGKIIGRSTTDLDSSEFTIYLNKVKAHAREFHNAYIAEPSDRSYSVWEQTTRERYDNMFLSL